MPKTYFPCISTKKFRVWSCILMCTTCISCTLFNISFICKIFHSICISHVTTLRITLVTSMLYPKRIVKLQLKFLIITYIIIRPKTCPWNTHTLIQINIWSNSNNRGYHTTCTKQIKVQSNYYLRNVIEIVS